MQAYSVLEPPTIQCVNLEEAKAATRIEYDVEDATLDQYLRAAVRWVELHINGLLERQTVDLTFWSWPSNHPCQWRVPWSYAHDIQSVTYTNESDAAVELADLVVSIERCWFEIRRAEPWPEDRKDPSFILIRAAVGFERCPEDIKQAVIAVFAHFERNRTSLLAPPEGVVNLLNRHRAGIVW